MNDRLILRSTIREFLYEADDRKSSEVQKSSKSSKDPNGELLDKKGNRIIVANEVIEFNNIADIFDKLQARDHWYALYRDIWEYLRPNQSGNPSGEGFVMFGVVKYSPIADLLGSEVGKILRPLIQAYKAYGHAYVQFVDNEGNSARYEFAFDTAGKCESIDRNYIINQFNEKILKDQKLGVRIYDSLMGSLGTVFGAIAGSIGGGVGMAAGALAGRQVKNVVDDATKSYIVREAIPVIVKNYPEKLSKLMHFNLPGKVYNNGPVQRRMLTAKKFAELAKIAAEKEGMSYDEGFDGNYYYLTFVNSRNAQWTYKVKNTVLEAYAFSSPEATNRPSEDVTTPTPVAADEAAGLLVFPASNVAKGVSWCQGIMSDACATPYTLPLPGNEVISPDMTNALNCGLFAAKAANQAISGFQFDLTNRSDIATSPASFFEQGQGVAIDTFAADTASYKMTP